MPCLQRVTRALVAVGLAASMGAFAACSSSSPSPTIDVNQFIPDTCRFLADKTNCWATLLSSIDECIGVVPDGGSRGKGVLSADGRTCTYPNGRVDTFVNPLDPTVQPKVFDVTVTVNGKTCVRYAHHTDGSIAVTGPEGRAATLVYTAPHQVKFTCPSGGGGYTGNDADLCALGGPGQGEFDIYGTGGASVQISNMTNSLFDCDKAP